jgi:hypothetical protein
MNNCLMSLGNDHRDEAHDEEIEIAFAAGYHRAYHEVLTAICLVEAGVPLRKPTRE